MARVMRRRLISISLRTRNSLSDFVGGLLYVVTKRKQRQRRRIDCRVSSDSASSRTPLSMGASFFLLACSLPGNPDCREARLSTIVKVPTPDFCEEDPHRGSLFMESLLGKLSLRRPSLSRRPRCRGPRCREALVAGGLRCRGPLLAGKLWPGGLRCRESLVAGRPSLGKHFRGVPQDSFGSISLETMARIRVFFWCP